MLDHALSYASAGFAVIPLHSPADGVCDCRRDCASPGKHPRTRNGLTDASTDPDTIRRWWEMWPRANIGVAIPDGYVVVDVDVAEASTATNGHDMPATATAKTGRGWHFLYRTATPVRPKVAVLEHVDIRGPGSYIVAAPSIHMSGEQYVWVASPKEGVADAPDWVLEAGSPSATVDPAAPGAPIPEGQRNDTLTRMAGAMRHHDMTVDEIEVALLAVNRRAGLPADEVQAIAQSVGRYAPGERGPVLALSAQREIPLGRQFRTAHEIVSERPPGWLYIARPWCALGMIAELDGKPKTAGKTTWLLRLIRAVLDGRPFLGEPTEQTPVVLLTEQSRASIAPTLAAAALDRDDLVILSWPDALGLSWAQIVALATEECVRLGARLLIVDTLGQFAGVRGDSENDAGAALEAMAPLQAAAAEHDLAVLVARHDRKGGGDIGESGRGSNAWTGAVDCVIALRRPLNPARHTIRELEAVSRRDDVSAEPLIIELVDDDYVVLDSAAVAFDEGRHTLVAHLSRAPQTETEILANVRRAGGTLSRSTFQRVRDDLLRSGNIERTGSGGPQDPYRYRLPKPSAQSAQRIDVGQTKAEAGLAPRPALNLSMDWDVAFPPERPVAS